MNKKLLILLICSIFFLRSQGQNKNSCYIEKLNEAVEKGYKNPIPLYFATSNNSLETFMNKLNEAVEKGYKNPIPLYFAISTKKLCN